MTPDTLVLVALTAIALMASAVMAIAWLDFGRQRHTLSWCAAFVVIAIAHLAQSTFDLAPFGGGLIGWGPSSALLAIGFRERAGLPSLAGPLICSAVINNIVILVLGEFTAPVFAVLLSCLFNAAMFAISWRTLTGRRREERLAEQLVAGSLIGSTALNLLFVATIFAAYLGVRFNTQAVVLGWISLMPAILDVMITFMIFMLAADLADRTRRLANIDMLTGLLNRRGFDQAAEAIIASARRNMRSIVLVSADIDRFKAINDSHGHAMGDRVIQAFANCLRDNLARRDLVARTGGEEFVIIMTDVDPHAALCAVEVLRARVCNLQVGIGETIAVTASFGLTELRPDDAGLGGLIARSDAALYRSKANGRNLATLAA